MNKFVEIIISIGLFILIFFSGVGLGLIVTMALELNYYLEKLIYSSFVGASVFIAYYVVAVFFRNNRLEILQYCVFSVVLILTATNLLLTKHFNAGSFFLGAIVMIVYHLFAAFVAYKITDESGKENKNPTQTNTVLDEAKKEYARREYKNAYKLFCEAESAGQLDSVSVRLKQLAEKRLANS